LEEFRLLVKEPQIGHRQYDQAWELEEAEQGASPRTAACGSRWPDP
jgi:hypothetical protein